MVKDILIGQTYATDFQVTGVLSIVRGILKLNTTNLVIV